MLTTYRGALNACMPSTNAALRQPPDTHNRHWQAEPTHHWPLGSTSIALATDANTHLSQPSCRAVRRTQHWCWQPACLRLVIAAGCDHNPTGRGARMLHMQEQTIRFHGASTATHTGLLDGHFNAIHAGAHDPGMGAARTLDLGMGAARKLGISARLHMRRPWAAPVNCKHMVVSRTGAKHQPRLQHAAMRRLRSDGER